MSLVEFCTKENVTRTDSVIPLGSTMIKFSDDTNKTSSATNSVCPESTSNTQTSNIVVINNNSNNGIDTDSDLSDNDNIFLHTGDRDKRN